MSKTDAGGVSLLPCPFCGESVAEIQPYESHGATYYRVRCDECWAQTHGSYHLSPKNAAEVWNTRSTPVRCDGEAVAWQYKHESNGDDGWCMLRNGENPTEFLKQWSSIKYDVRPLYAAPPARSDADSCPKCGINRNSPFPCECPASPPPSGVREALEAPTADILVGVLQTMGKTEREDIDFLLDRLGLSLHGFARDVIASFRRQIIVVAASEAALQLPATNKAGSATWGDRLSDLPDILERAKMLNSADAMRRAIDEAIALVRGSQAAEHGSYRRTSEVSRPHLSTPEK